jgi:hypothetical protein
MKALAVPTDSEIYLSLTEDVPFVIDAILRNEALDFVSDVTKRVPSSCRYQLLKFTPVIKALSAALVTCEDVVGITDVIFPPDSSCASVQEPETVRVKVPAVGVNVKVDLSG